MSKVKRILTGDRPTGPLHLGHYIGSLQNRVRLQEDSEQFVMLADIQALTDNMGNVSRVRDAVLEVALDYLAVGIDPEKTTIFIQSEIPALAEMTVHLMNLVSVDRVSRNPTVKSEIKERGYGKNCTAGFFMYPVSQVADIVSFRADTVPAGEDQKPMIELTNELVRRFRREFDSDALVECELLKSSHARLPGTDGKSKMGKSLGNAIYLSESSTAIKKKVDSMYTDPNHLRVEDPGNTTENPVFIYLDAFDPDRERFERMKAHYERGGLGDGEVKQCLNEVLQEMLAPIRSRREELAQNPDEIFEILRHGTDRARKVAQQTLDRVKDDMGISYFRR